VLPEEVPVSEVLDFRERNALAVDRSRDHVAFSLALAQQNVRRDGARGQIEVHGALLAGELSLQDLARLDKGSGEGTRRLGETRKRRHDEPLALERLEAQLGEDLVGDRRGRRVEDCVIPGASGSA